MFWGDAWRSEVEWKRAVGDDDGEFKNSEMQMTAGGSVVKEGLKPLYSD